jgi:hypothetical protein
MCLADGRVLASVSPVRDVAADRDHPGSGGLRADGSVAKHFSTCPFRQFAGSWLAST